MASDASKRTFGRALHQIPLVWKVLLIMGACLLTAWKVGAVVSTTVQLPARIDANRQEFRDSIADHARQLDAITHDLKDLKRTVDQSLCYDEAQAGVRKVVECLRQR